MVWQGVILEESLSDKSLLNMVKIVNTESDKLEEEDKTTIFYKIEVENSIISDFLNEVSETIKSGFYAHLCKDGEMYVIYRGVTFKFTKKDDDVLKMAKKYGESVNIPKEQMPFEHLIDHPFD